MTTRRTEAIRRVRVEIAKKAATTLWCRCTHGDDEHTRGVEACTHLLYFKGKRTKCPCQQFTDATVPVFNPVLPAPVVPEVLAKLQRVTPPMAAAPPSITQGETMTTATAPKQKRYADWTCPKCSKTFTVKGKGAHMAMHRGILMGWNAHKANLAANGTRPRRGAGVHHNDTRAISRQPDVVQTLKAGFKTVARPITTARHDREWLALINAVAKTATSGKAISFTSTTPQRGGSICASLRVALKKRGLAFHYKMQGRKTAVAWADRRGRRAK